MKIRKAFSILFVLILCACAAMNQQKKSEAVRADNAEFHNLQVISPNVTHDELIATMRGFTRALGVKCDHCHVALPPGSKEHFDFPSDAKKEKNVARTMLRMTRNINAEYLSHVNEHGQMVTCYTCHRGKSVPDVMPPAAPERERPPAPPQPR
jgi:predicted trehalose synthase